MNKEEILRERVLEKLKILEEEFFNGYGGFTQKQLVDHITKIAVFVRRLKSSLEPSIYNE